MLHHVSLGTNDIARARRFYDPVLELLGLRVTFEDEKAVGYGASETVFSLETPVDGEPATVGNGVHIAFQAGDRSKVDEFHRLGLASGGTSDGAPGTRPDYDLNYYAAFLRDPDGNKVEALTFTSK